MHGQSDDKTKHTHTHTHTHTHVISFSEQNGRARGPRRSESRRTDGNHAAFALCFPSYRPTNDIHQLKTIENKFIYFYYAPPLTKAKFGERRVTSLIGLEEGKAIGKKVERKAMIAYSQQTNTHVTTKQKTFPCGIVSFVLRRLLHCQLTRHNDDRERRCSQSICIK
jgi:hypothetical protein